MTFMKKTNIRIVSINLVLVLAVVGIAFWGWSALHPSAAKVTTTTALVSTGDVSATVSAAGTVISPGDIGVSPSVSAQISSINVHVGQKVTRGQLMAVLDSTALRNSLNQAKSTLSMAQIAYAQNKTNTDAAVTAAQKALNDSQQTASTAQNSVDSAQRALDAATLTLTNLQWTNQQNRITTLNGGELTVDYCKTYASNYGTTNGNVATTNSTNCNTLIADSDAVVNAQAALAAAKAAQSVSVSSLQTAYNSAVASQKFTMDNFKAQHGINVDNPKASDFTVDQAALAVAQKNYDAAFIKAPASGVVASISAAVGQFAPTASSSVVGSVSGFIVLTGVSGLEVSSSFSESDAAKLVAGQTAAFTFSALPSVNATGKLLSVDLLPTVASGATSYKATFSLDSSAPELKSGMTATTTVTTGAAFNVLQVAAQAVTTRGTGSFVNVLTTKNGKDVITRTPVVLGLIGDSADQILSGINAGAKVVLPSAKTSVGANGFPSGPGLGVAIAGGGFGGGGGGRGGGG